MTENRRRSKKRSTCVSFMAALQHQAALAKDGPLTLAPLQLGPLFDDIEGRIAGAPEHRKGGAVVVSAQRIVAPFSGGDHAPIQAQDGVQFQPVEENRTARRTILRSIQAHQNRA
jgi:hypothetical protein